MAKKELKTGDSVTITNRMYAVVDNHGRICKTRTGHPGVFSTRQEAREFCLGGDRVIRLNDLVGTIVR